MSTVSIPCALGEHIYLPPYKPLSLSLHPSTSREQVSWSQQLQFPKDLAHQLYSNHHFSLLCLYYHVSPVSLSFPEQPLGLENSLCFLPVSCHLPQTVQLRGFASTRCLHWKMFSPKLQVVFELLNPADHFWFLFCLTLLGHCWMSFLSSFKYLLLLLTLLCMRRSWMVPVASMDFLVWWLPVRFGLWEAPADNRRGRRVISGVSFLSYQDQDLYQVG